MESWVTVGSYHGSPQTFWISKEAGEVMSELGRWFSFQINNTTPICLEKGQLPAHLASIPSVDSPTPLQTLLMELEDSGEAWLINGYYIKVNYSRYSDLLWLTIQTQLCPNKAMLPQLPCQVNVQITHHTLNGDDLSSEKQLVFVLDDVKEPKEPKKRKKGKTNKSPGPTFKNFGSFIDVDKLKQCAKFTVGWRCRLHGHAVFNQSLAESSCFFQTRLKAIMASSKSSETQKNNCQARKQWKCWFWAKETDAHPPHSLPQWHSRHVRRHCSLDVGLCQFDPLTSWAKRSQFWVLVGSSCDQIYI